jgi:hypothetical protein
LSPDASWIRRERWERLGPEEREGFGSFCPDAVFEVRSSSPTLQELRQKMQSYLRNGAVVGVLIDPYAGTVEVYRPRPGAREVREPGAGRAGSGAGRLRAGARAGVRRVGEQARPTGFRRQSATTQAIRSSLRAEAILSLAGPSHQDLCRHSTATGWSVSRFLTCSR